MKGRISASGGNVDKKATSVQKTWIEEISVTTDDDGKNVSNGLALYGLERREDGLLYWRADSEQHPRNWTTRRKAYDTTVIILLEFYTTLISTTGAAVANAAGPELGLSDRDALIAFTFMYQLGQATGGLLIPPLSELVGRRNPYLVSTLVFSLFSLLIGHVPSPATAFIGRFAMGLASAAPSVVVAGSVEDMFNTRRRVWVVAVWNVATTAALCLGPVYAAYIIVAASWRWVLWSSAAATAVLLAALLPVRESRPSLLLRRQVELLRRHWRRHPPGAAERRQGLRCADTDASPNMHTLLQLVVVRPCHILATEPILGMVAVISAVSWGVIYLFTEALTRIYEDMGFGAAQASLPFLSMMGGVLLSFLPRFWDMRIVRRREARGERVEPEDKIVGFALAAPALFGGLIWFAWTVPPMVPRLHWIVPTLALVPIGFAVNEIAYTLSSYLADAYLLYSASAFAGLAMVRAIVSGLMPLIAREIYPTLGANVAGSVLAGIALVFCLAPWAFFRYSKRLRERSPFACYSLGEDWRTRVEDE